MSCGPHNAEARPSMMQKQSAEVAEHHGYFVGHFFSLAPTARWRYMVGLKISSLFTFCLYLLILLGLGDPHTGLRWGSRPHSCSTNHQARRRGSRSGRGQDPSLMTDTISQLLPAAPTCTSCPRAMQRTASGGGEFCEIYCADNLVLHFYTSKLFYSKLMEDHYLFYNKVCFQMWFVSIAYVCEHKYNILPRYIIIMLFRPM